MIPDPFDFDPSAAEPPAAVGAYVVGPPDGPRQVVRWANQLRDHHEIAEHVDTDVEGYLSAFCYPPTPYIAHFKAGGYSPRGYVGPAGCQFLLFDIDRGNDLDAALNEARTLLQFLLSRYCSKLDDGIGAHFSGSKGFHLFLELLPAFAPAVAVPAVCKRQALMIAAEAGVRIDTGCYDHQRLVRLPNSRHPRTGLHKRILTHEELFTLDVARIKELARHPAAFPVPRSGEFSQELQDDFDRAAANVTLVSLPRPGGFPIVPVFVREFIGLADVQDPGRAVTLFRCSAALAEAGTPGAVIIGLLEEPALKTGLEAREVAKQLRDGIARGRQGGLG